MAREVRSFAAVIPAGTPLAAPVTVSLVMPARVVRGVRVRIPPGPNGELGWALASSGVNIIPWGSAQWMVMDDEIVELPLESQITSGSWQVRGYNTGRYPHTVYVTFLLDPVGSVANGQVVSSPVVVTA